MNNTIKIPKNISRVRDEFSDFQTFLSFAEKNWTSFSWKNVNFYELWEKNSFITTREHLGTCYLACLGDFINDKIRAHVHWLLNYDFLEKEIVKLLQTDKVQTVCALVQKRGRLYNLLKSSKKKVVKSLEQLDQLITLLKNSQPEGYKPDITISYRFKSSYTNLNAQIQYLKQWTSKL